MDAAGIGAMHRSQDAPEPVSVARDEDEMNVVGHEHPGPYRDTRRPGVLRQKITVAGVIFGTKKDLRATVSALRHMMRNARQDRAGETGHANMLPQAAAERN